MLVSGNWPDDQANLAVARSCWGWGQKAGGSWEACWTPSTRAYARLPILNLNLDSGFESQRKRQVLRVRTRRDSSGGGAGGPDRFIEGKTGVGVSAVRKSLPVAWPPGNSVPRRRRGFGWREPAAGVSALPSYPAGWEGGKLAGRQRIRREFP